MEIEWCGAWEIGSILDDGIQTGNGLIDREKMECSVYAT